MDVVAAMRAEHGKLPWRKGGAQGEKFPVVRDWPNIVYVLQDGFIRTGILEWSRINWHEVDWWLPVNDLTSTLPDDEPAAELGK